MYKLKKRPEIEVLCVGYNSQRYYASFTAAIKAQRDVSSRITILEQGPSAVEHLEDVEILRGPNLGYGGGNNYLIKMRRLAADFIAIINPDCLLLDPFAFRKMVAEMNGNPSLMMLQPILLGFDYSTKLPTGLFDSLGIVRTWYGRWYDIFQGRPVAVAGDILAPKPRALCGACILLRRKLAYDLIEKQGFVFDPRFFMYKEDIELSLRISSMGYKIAVAKSAVAFHCRGWKISRREMPWEARWHSAKNELRLNKREVSPLVYSALKLAYVATFERVAEIVTDLQKEWSRRRIKFKRFLGY